MSEAQQLQFFFEKKLLLLFKKKNQEKRHKMHKGTSQYLSIISYSATSRLSHLLVRKSNQWIYMNIEGTALKLNE